MKQGASAMTTEAKDAGVEVLHEWTVNEYGYDQRIVTRNGVPTCEWKYSKTSNWQLDIDGSSFAVEIARLAARLSALEDCVRKADDLRWEKRQAPREKYSRMVWLTYREQYDTARALVVLPEPAGQQRKEGE